MIVQLAFRSIAFAALLGATLDWQMKLFLASSLLLIEFGIALLDFQANQNHHIHYQSLLISQLALDLRLGNSDAQSVKSALEEFSRHEQLNERVSPLWKFNYLVYFGSVAISFLIGWLLSTFLFPFLPSFGHM